MEQSRRDFLRLAGKGVMGAAALTALPTVVAGAEGAEGTEAPTWPWTWHHLDTEKVKAKVVENFSKNGGCGAAVCSGILDLLAEEYGYPYNQIPARLMAHAGGGYGNKNLCGSLGGAFVILGLFAENPGPLRSKLYEFYTTTEFPVYQPADKPEHLVHSVSASELCRDSVNHWIDTYNAASETQIDFSSPERAVRCSCLSADVAAKTCELLDELWTPVAEEPAPELADNEYIGVGKGKGGTTKVKVTMDGDKISKIDVLEHADDADYYNKADPDLLNNIISANSADIDGISGATLTSNGILEAVKDALSQVKK